MVLDTLLLNTQPCKVRIKGKVEQPKERSSALRYTSVQQLLKREPSDRCQLRSTTLLTFQTIQSSVNSQSNCQIHFYFYFKQFSLVISSNLNNSVQNKYNFSLQSFRCQNSCIYFISVQRKYSVSIKNCSISNNSAQLTKTVQFQTIRFSISNQFQYQNSLFKQISLG